MIKAVFFDVDGTLLSHRRGEVPPSAREAVFRLKQKGLLVFAATGRHILELETLPVRDLPFDGFVTLNGQLCLDREGAVLYDAPISPASAERLAAAFRGMETPLMILERGRMYVNFVDERVRRAQKAISSPVPETGLYTGAPVYQVIAYDTRERVLALLEELPDCGMSQWNPFGFDIISKAGGKVPGLQRLLDRFDLRREEIMAFGDGDNDREMLRFAAVGVAMGNAEAAVKDQADFVTTDIDEDGIRRGLERYGLIEEGG